MNKEKEGLILLSDIEKLDKEIRGKSKALLLMRNRFLIQRGWKVTSEVIGPTRSYFYKKYDEVHVCEHTAIDREINGEEVI